MKTKAIGNETGPGYQQDEDITEVMDGLMKQAKIKEESHENLSDYVISDNSGYISQALT